MFLKDAMRLRAANSALAVGAAEGRLGLGEEGESSRLFPRPVLWGSGGCAGAAVAPAAVGVSCTGSSSEGGIRFSRYKPLLCCLAEERYVVWHKIPCSSAFRM